MTDRTAPAKEARSELTDEELARYASPHWNWPTDLSGVQRMARELQSRRSSPVREGDGGLPDLSPSDIAPSAGKDHPVFAFLLGSAPLNGLWFGETPPPTDKVKRKQPFWWRFFLRNALSQMAQSNDHARSAEALEIARSVVNDANPEEAAHGLHDNEIVSICRALLSPSEPSGRGESGGIQGPASEASMNKEVT